MAKTDWEVPLAMFVCKEMDLTHCRQATERPCQGRSLVCAFAEHSARSAQAAVEACHFWHFEVDREQDSTAHELVEFCRYANVARYFMIGAFGGMLYKAALRLLREEGADTKIGRFAKEVGNCIQAAECDILPVIRVAEALKRQVMLEMRRGKRSPGQHDPRIEQVLKSGQARMRNAIRSLREIHRKGVEMGRLVRNAGHEGNP